MDATQEIYQKQFSLGEIFSKSWKVFIENIELILIINIPLTILSGILWIIAQNLQYAIKIASFFGKSTVLQSSLALSLTIIATVVLGISWIATTLLIKDKIDGRVVDVQNIAKKTFSKLLPSIGLVITITLFEFILFLLLVVPAIIFGIFWYFVFHTFVLEGKFKNAFKYSKEIVKGRWLTVFMYVFVFSIITFVISSLIEVLFAFLPNNIWFSVIPSTVSGIIRIFFMVASVVFFVNFDATKKIEIAQ